MKKKIKIGIKVSNTQESGLPKLLEEYSKYRKYNIKSYLSVLPSHHICIYCNSGDYIVYGKVIRVPFDKSSVCRNFTEWYGDKEKLRYDSDSKNILFITDDGIIVGLYVDKVKSLILMDIVHYDWLDHIRIAARVLDFILDALNKEGIKDSIFTKSKKCYYKLQSVGTDPEFELFKDGYLLRANEVYNSLHDPIGCDGAGDQLELRPTAGSVSQVVKSLRTLLLKVRQDGFDIGLTNYYSCGGHIHFGYGQAMTPSSGFLEALDDFLGIPTRRLIYRSGYGHLSDYEVKPWGFEYRTPSAAIFTNKKIAYISLKIAYLIGSKVGRTIEYNYPPTKEDYVRLGLTKRQAEYFLDFVNNFSSPIQSIYGGWKISPTFKGVKVKFSDEWDEGVVEKIKEELKKVRTKNPIYITLFGLKAERGRVNTIPVQGYEVIEHHYQTKTTIGVAREIRFGKNITVFIKALKKYIRENLKK